MALLDGDRFEGRFRDGAHVADVSDLMRRMVKEKLLTFEAKPLFPERAPPRTKILRKPTCYSVTVRGHILSRSD